MRLRPRRQCQYSPADPGESAGRGVAEGRAILCAPAEWVLAADRRRDRPSRSRWPALCGTAGNPEGTRYHEAGYDAFLTGSIFTKMFFALGKDEQMKVENAINTLKCPFYPKLDGEDVLYKEVIIISVSSIK